MQLVKWEVASGWDKTNFSGQIRDQEIRLIQNYNGTKKDWTLIFCTRRDQHETVTILSQIFHPGPTRDKFQNFVRD